MTPRPPRPTDPTRIGARDVTDWRSAWGKRLAHWATRVGGDSTAGRWVAHWRVALVTLLVGAVAAILATAAAAEVSEQVVGEHNGIAGLDRPALDWSVAHRPGWFASLVTDVTFVGGGIGLPILTVIIGGLFWWRRHTLAPLFILAAAGAGSLAMTMVGKAIIGRARPPLALAVPPYEHSPAFPSGHTLNSTTLALVAGYLVLLAADRRWLRWLTIAVALAFPIIIGLTRVYLGHHWLTDVVAGWMLGAAWSAVVITSHRLYLTVRGHLADHPHPTPSPDDLHASR